MMPEPPTPTPPAQGEGAGERENGSEALQLVESPSQSSDQPVQNKQKGNVSASVAKRSKQAPWLPDVIATPINDLWPRPYYFEDGLRKVKPYFWTYSTYCKERWRGMSLIDIFSIEFRDRTPEYYRRAMEKGDILVNGKKVGPDHVIQNGDLINNTVHRHEATVTGAPMEVLHEDDDLLVINKPSGVPVHPTGRFKFNSVTEILRSERGSGFVPRPCHRLDRLTSGVLFIGKTPQAALDLSEEIRVRKVRKEYVARVQGRFPDGEVVCDRPILAISPRLGLNRVRADGKPARTVFKRLAYYPPSESTAEESQSESERTKSPDELADLEKRPWIAKKGYSIVRCLPLTGRTHQLRVHLQFLGHPIQNDPIYANQRVWSANLGHNDVDGAQDKDEDIISRLERMGKHDVADALAYHEEVVDSFHKRRSEKLSGEHCDVCSTPLYSDPGLQELSLWLHSLRYEHAEGNWSYTSPLPSWALPPAGGSGPTQVGGMDALVEAVKDDHPEIASQSTGS